MTRHIQYFTFAWIILILTGRSLFAEPKIQLLEEAKEVSARQIRKASKSESQMSETGGFLANPNMLDCFAAMQYHYTGGRYHNEPIRFRLYSPQKIEPGRKYPLIIHLHGVGESGLDNTNQLSHMQTTIRYFAGESRLDFFMVATQCPSEEQGWTRSLSQEGKGDAPLTILDEIVDTLIEEYPIDQDAISLFGICSGGGAAWEYAARHPNKFAALGACSSSPVFRTAPTNSLRTSYWSFNNRDDRIPYQDVVQFVNAVNAAGGEAAVSLRDLGGHDAWSRALSEENVITWLVFQNRVKGGPVPGIVYYHRSLSMKTLMFGLPLTIIAGTLFWRLFRRLAVAAPTRSDS